MSGSTHSERRPRLIAALALIGVAVLATAGVVVFRGGYEPGGPLASARETSVTTHSAPGEPMTWGTVLPENPTDSDIVLELVEPSEPATGLTVLGIGVNDPREAPVGTADGYPAAGVTPADVSGAVMTPRDGNAPYLQVIVGVSLDDVTEGRISGLRIRYTNAGHRYETVLSDALIVVPPDS